MTQITLDSAVNNHHRFVRAQQVKQLTFPAYEQEKWVSAQGYAERPWSELIGFWRLYNRHLAHVISLISEEKLAVICVIGTNEPVTLGYLIEDYLVHMRHHLQELRSFEATPMQLRGIRRINIGQAVSHLTAAGLPDLGRQGTHCRRVGRVGDTQGSLVSRALLALGESGNHSR